MTNFKLNDVVIVTKNPPNQIVKIKGDIGYIDEFQEATNEKGEVVKYVYFKTIELNSFCGGMGSVPIDCIELCDNPVYLKRFQEILEHQKKENEKYDLIQAFSQLEKNLKDREEEIIKLKEKSENELRLNATKLLVAIGTTGSEIKENESNVNTLIPFTLKKYSAFLNASNN